MKSTLLLLLAALFTTALVSCQSTGTASSDKAVTAVVNAGKAYLLATGKVKPADQAAIDAAAQVLITGKFDPEKLLAIASERLKAELPDADKQAIADLGLSLIQGKTDQAALMALAKQAAIRYAQTQGLPPEQTAAVLALAGLFEP